MERMAAVLGRGLAYADELSPQCKYLKTNAAAMSITNFCDRSLKPVHKAGVGLLDRSH
jgi:hypothetical protein